MSPAQQVIHTATQRVINRNSLSSGKSCASLFQIHNRNLSTPRKEKDGMPLPSSSMHTLA
jgi:hypothetical protein